MNRTNFEHLVLALILQAIPGFLWGDWIIGAIFASAVFLGREHAQREYHIGDPSKLVGYEALDFWNWKLDALLDLFMPVAGVWSVAFLLWLQNR
ncbi:hypothetical protein [Propionivibrio sp.]|uniref:hypothetical protein n=1 Tax=Propionivibrio sp. TaxID=2212460 RepID=UPI003BF07F03